MAVAEGRLSRARRWDYAGSTIPASEPVYPNVPASTPAWDLHFAYSQGHRVLKSASQDGVVARLEARKFGPEVGQRFFGFGAAGFCFGSRARSSA